jgi:hypothetical protein
MPGAAPSARATALTWLSTPVCHIDRASPMRADQQLAR